MASVIEGVFVGIVVLAPIIYQTVLRGDEINSNPVLRGVLIGWAGLVLMYVVYTRKKQGAAIERQDYAFAKTANSLGARIDHLTRLIYPGRQSWSVRPSLGGVIVRVLDEMVKVTEQLVACPPTTNFCAVLMLPVDDPPTTLSVSLHSEACSSPRPSYSSEVGVGDVGAGAAFYSREPFVVEDTEDPAWNGLFSGGKYSRYRAFVAFPVVVEERNQQCLGCVNIETSMPYVITEAVALRLLHDALRPQLELIALALLFGEKENVPLH